MAYKMACKIKKRLEGRLFIEFLAERAGFSVLISYFNNINGLLFFQQEVLYHDFVPVLGRGRGKKRGLVNGKVTENSQKRSDV